MKETTQNSRYLDNSDGVIFDQHTNLMWMKNDTWIEFGSLMSWHKAQEYLKKLNEEKFAGYQNWRFPTGNEAKSLYDDSSSNHDREGCEIFIDSIFPAGCGYTTWTSETRGAKAAMGFDYRANYEYWLAKENEGFPSGVRFVRSHKSQKELEKEKARFVNSGKGAVIDLETGLMWKKNDSFIDLDKWVSWEEGKTYCIEQNRNRFQGHEDWRMPTRKEAQTICDLGNPITDTYGDTVYLVPVFPPGAGATCWTKTLNKNDSSLAIRFHFYNGDYKWHKRGLRSHGVRAVRAMSPEELILETESE